MILGGLEKLSLIDFPHHLSAVVFTKGCNFRCHYCYNPMLVRPDWSDKKENNEKDYLLAEDDLFRFFRERVGLLDGIVITGGEPTLHADLPEFINKIKSLGFDVKLDSNGTNPQMLEMLIKESLVDYVAMDIKGHEDNYKKVVDVDCDILAIKKSISILQQGLVDYEFRTTIVPGILSAEDIAKMAQMIAGPAKWYLQQFKGNTELVDEKWRDAVGYSDREMSELVQVGSKHVLNCSWR